MKRIYLDYAATTPLLPEAKEAMLAWLESGFGNPSSLHAEGRAAKAAIDASREKFAQQFGCLFGEVIFTGSGTEAANLAVIGAALKSNRRRILLGAAEHHCVLHTRSLLEQLGYQVDLIPVDCESVVHPDSVEGLLNDEVALVSVMHANNEFGSINPVDDIAERVKKFGAVFHVDAVQTFPGDWKVNDWDADLVSVSAHKFYGPKAVGALYCRAGIELQPLALGGGQEREMRAGTENVAGIVGASAALEWVHSHPIMKSVARDAFESALTIEREMSIVSAKRLDGHCHFRIPGLDAETFLIRLDREGISASSGAACSSGSLEPSHVMMAAGRTEAEAREGLRFTFGKGSTVAEAIQAAEIVNNVGQELLDKMRK